MKWEDLPDALRKKIIASDPANFNAAGIRPVGPVAAHSAKQAASRPLDQGTPEQAGGSASLGVRVTLVALRRRLLDRDAVAFACKPLADSIAKSLAIDDDDPRIQWEYAQEPTYGAEGVIVKIEVSA